MGEQKIGNDAVWDNALQAYVVEVPADHPLGPHQIFARLSHEDGSKLETVKRNVTFQEPVVEPPPPTGTLSARWITNNNSVATEDDFLFVADATNTDTTDPIVRGDLIQISTLGYASRGALTADLGWTKWLDVSAFPNGTYTFVADFYTRSGRKVSTTALTLNVLRITTPPASSARNTLLKAVGMGGQASEFNEFQNRHGRRILWSMKFTNKPGAPDGNGLFTNQFHNTFSDWVDYANGQPDDVNVVVSVGNVPVNGSLANVANGTYNANWHKMGQTMARLRNPRNFWLRINWEFNGGWFVWTIKQNGARSTTREVAFRNGWRVMWTQCNNHMGGKRVNWDWNFSAGATNDSQAAFDLLQNTFPAAPGSGWEHVVDSVSLDIYGQDTHNGYNGMMAKLNFATRLAKHNEKRVALMEGSPVVWKYYDGKNHGYGLTQNKGNIDALYDWGIAMATERVNGLPRLVCINLFERDPRPEGFFAFVTGQSNMGTRQNGEERLRGLNRLLHPAEHKRNLPAGAYYSSAGGSGHYVFESNASGPESFTYRATASPEPSGYHRYATPPGVPFGVSVPDRRQSTYRAYRNVGGPRDLHVQSNFAPEADYWMDKFGGPLQAA